MKKILVIVGLLSSFLFADFIGAGVGFGGFNHSSSGWVQYNGDEIDIDDDLHLKSETGTYFWGYIEHPVPFLPNIKVKYFEITQSGEGVLTANRTFGGVTYTVADYVKSTISLDQFDTTLYYELLDNWVSLDVGLNIKYIDFSAVIDGTISGETSKSADIFIPQGYIAAKFTPPFFGDFEGKVELATISYSGNSLTDLSLSLEYSLAGFLGFDAGIELGYKSQKIKIDDVADISADIEINGLFSSIFFNF